MGGRTERTLQRVERGVGDLQQRVHHEVSQAEGRVIALALLGYGDTGHGRRHPGAVGCLTYADIGI